ncbi:MAG: hypothetical protein HY608_10050 [Planctomycetes bacterium]|nr:hypothetical protein [Planctomycetota bacterium]
MPDTTAWDCRAVPGRPLRSDDEILARLLGRYLAGFGPGAGGLRSAVGRLAARGCPAATDLRDRLEWSGTSGYPEIARAWRRLSRGAPASARGEEEIVALARLARGVAAVLGGRLAPEAARMRVAAALAVRDVPAGARRIASLLDQGGGTNEWSVPESPWRDAAFRGEVAAALRELRTLWSAAGGRS